VENGVGKPAASMAPNVGMGKRVWRTPIPAFVPVQGNLDGDVCFHDAGFGDLSHLQASRELRRHTLSDTSSKWPGRDFVGALVVRGALCLCGRPFLATTPSRSSRELNNRRGAKPAHSLMQTAIEMTCSIKCVRLSVRRIVPSKVTKAPGRGQVWIVSSGRTVLWSQV
jgi:hypothetical protein